MENLTKALLIAAGVLFGVLILSIIVFVFNQVSIYFNTTEEQKLQAAIIRFNAEYEKYTSNVIKGNDLLSLIYKVEDYNKREAETDGIKYQKMTLTINLGNLDDYRYTTNVPSGRTYPKLKSTLTNRGSDKYGTLVIATDMLSGVSSYGVTEAQAKKLATNISNLFDVYDNRMTAERKAAAIATRNEIVKKIMGSSYNVASESKIQKVENAALIYYQYIEFKKKEFSCTASKYDTETGRIVEMTFNVK